MYISSYWPSNPISSVQSEEPHVMDHLSKFHLNRTINKSENASLRKLCEPEKLVVPSAQNQTTSASGTKIPPGGYCYAKSTKNSVFHESTHHAPLVWRLAANMVPPSGSCSSRNPEISSTPSNLIPTPTILIPLDLRSNRRPSHVYIHYSLIILLHIRNSTNLTT